MISELHHRADTADWLILTPRHAPEETLDGHLTFALKWEGIDLLVLSALFQVLDERELLEALQSTPQGAYRRRIWFLYEWLTGRRLDLPDLGKMQSIPLVDLTQQFGLSSGVLSPRHRVLDNLPGTRAFCPMVRRTPRLIRFAEERFDVKARDLVGRIHPDITARAAAFLLVSDSKSSFWIEGEQASPQRIVRWGQALAKAGSHSLSLAEFERLQRIVIGDARLVKLGLRQEGGFIGMHDRTTHEPIPEHVSAKAEDLQSLVEGIIAYAARNASKDSNPIVTAAALSFGFVYIHPFEDGNGRIHRWLIHHVLAESGYHPPGLVFPVSAAILRKIDAYRQVLESVTRPLLPFIDWRPTPHGNVEVLNQTAHFYRYFDATEHAEFLADCIEQTVKHDLPDEIAYLQAYDQFAREVQLIADMPSNTIDLLHRFLKQGEGTFSKRARTKEFVELTEAELLRIEALYRSCFPEELACI